MANPKRKQRPSAAALARAKENASQKLTDAAECLTVQEVAARCKVHPETVKRWIGSDRLKAFKLGGHWRVRPAAITAYLKSQGA